MPPKHSPADSPERQFLRENIDDYLLRDLDSMLTVARAEWDRGGGLGYPIVMACCAGVELLGQISSLRDINGEPAFKHFWTTHLYPEVDHGDEIAAGVYAAARHGIAHLFLLKHSFRIVLDNPQYHLKNDDDGAFYVDAAHLVSDFRAAYENRVVPMCSLDPADRNYQRFVGHIKDVSSGLRPNSRVAPSVASAGPPITLVRPSAASGAELSERTGYSASGSAAMPIFPPEPR